MPTKDLFISYGRRESLGFVGRLHQQLKLAGYDGWFDKVNIPDGEDYAARINHGIETADNFAYVMAPRCLTSPYCLIELEYARILGKRVIPLNQMVIFQTDSKELSDGDKAVLTGFYAHYDVPNQHITNTQQVLDRSLALVGRTDWLDAKEKLSDEDCDELAIWAQGYENHWHKHDNLDYLKTFEFPVFGENVDALTSVVECMKIVLERHKDYVQKHTEILIETLTWQNNQQAIRYLLVGKERLEAEDWLLTEFIEGEQAPCYPTDAQCEFICESRKNSHNMMCHTFVCYDVADKAIRDEVVRLLTRHAITTWQHDHDIQEGSDFARAIEYGIETADNFIYFISPASVCSEYCQKELVHALQYHKRIIPLLIVETLQEEIPESIRGLQHINFIQEIQIDPLLKILRHDQAYYEQHKIFLARALKWQKEHKKPTFLLRGHNLNNALIWLRLNKDRVEHPPTEHHQALIVASEAAKGQLSAEVFISYSRKDGDFARKLNLALQEAGKTTWFDQESISSGVDFEQEIFKGIDGSDNFIFIISPDAVESSYCEREVNYASMQNKRFVPILWRKIDPSKMPQTLKAINWIDFETVVFGKAFPELIQTLDLDREHTHQHTVWQQRATDWVENERSGDFLLNSTACKNAEIWHESAQTKKKQPTPTSLQQEFIQASRQAIEAAERKERREKRWKMMLVSAIAGLIVLGLAVFSWEQMKEAQKVEAKSLARLGELKSSQSVHKEAGTAYQRAAESLPTGNEELLADYLNKAGNAFDKATLYRQAEPLHERSLAIRKQILGKQHPNTAISLNDLALLYEHQGKYKQALPLFQEALQIREQAFGKLHSDTATSLSNLAELYQNQGNYEKALPLFQEVLQIREQVLGNFHPDTAASLDNLARLYEEQGEYEKALPLFQKALKIYEQAHPNYTVSLNNLAKLYVSQGNYETALPLYQQALQIREQISGKLHPDTAQILYNLAGLYYAQGGEYKKALSLVQQALQIEEQVLGKLHPDYAKSLNGLAVLYGLQSEYEKALPLYQQVLQIREQVLGKRHPDYALSLNNLGGLYKSLGKYEKALPFFQQALQIREQVLGKQHPDYALSLNTLGRLYKSQGKYKKALPFFQQALQIREQVLGKQHPNYVYSLDGLAELYKVQSNYEKALPLLQQALQIREQVLGKQHPDYAYSLNNLAELYRLQSKYEKALPLFQQALQIEEQVLSKLHPDYAETLNNLGALYQNQGEYEKALPLIEQALQIREQALGKQHPDYAMSLNNLAGLYESQGDYEKAILLYERSLAIFKQALGDQHPYTKMVTENCENCLKAMKENGGER